MKWIRKKENNNKCADKIAALLATQLHGLQRRFTSFMAARTAGLSKRALMVGLGLFCLGFGGASLIAFLRAFQRPTLPAIKPAALTVPKYYKQPGEPNSPSLTPKDWEHINHFKTYMDSLFSTEEGRAVYDSLIRERPGLLDTLQLISTIFYSPLK